MNINPIRHGDWHVIDGQLIDLSQTPPEVSQTPEAVTGSDADSSTPPPSLPPSSPKRRNTPSSED